MSIPKRTDENWRKSSYSSSGSNCVEVALGAADVGVRDTKDRPGGQLTVDGEAWRAALATFARS